MMTLHGLLHAAQKQLQEIVSNLALRDESTYSPDDYVWLIDYLNLKLEQTSDFITLAIEQLQRELGE